jgi:hypothetical protein
MEALARDWRTLIDGVSDYCGEALATALALLLEQAVLFGALLAIIYLVTRK